MKCVRGHKDNGWSNALDGFEGGELRYTAAEQWALLGMDRLRSRRINQVRAQHAAGTLRWEHVDSLVHAFPKRGQLDCILEGQEAEDHSDNALTDGHPWKTEEDAELEKAAEREEDAAGLAALPAEPAPSGLLVSVPGSRAETAADCSDRLVQMDALLAAAKSVNEPGLVQHVEKLQRRLSRLTVGASTSLEEVDAPHRATSRGPSPAPIGARTARALRCLGGPSAHQDEGPARPKGGEDAGAHPSEGLEVRLG